MPEETQGYKLSQPKQSLAEYQQMGMSPLMSWEPQPTLSRSLANGTLLNTLCPVSNITQ